MSKFVPYGPFEMPVDGAQIDRTRENEFWNNVRLQHPGLPKAVGCYIFAIRAGRGIKPWYVGKTERLGFQGESWQPHKLLHYQGVLAKRERGTPLLHFLAKYTKSGKKFARPTTNELRSVRTLEKMLMAACLRRNGNLCNKSGKRPLQIEVPGFMNESPGQRTREARDLAQLLGVTK